MPTFCSAFGCSNSSRKELCRKKGISFHKFPLEDKVLLHKWLMNIRRADFNPTLYSFICSSHFKEEDFVYQRFTNRRGLKKGSIPTKFSFNYSSRRKKCLSNNQNLEIQEEDHGIKPELESNNTVSNEIQMDTYALVEIYMNEKFYPPEKLKALAKNLPVSLKPVRKSRNLEERIASLKESLHAKILLRNLKKQLLLSEIKAANAKRDYYEARKAMLSKIQSDSEDSSDFDSSLWNIKTRLDKEELAAQIEERMLQEQLEEVEMHAANNRMEYKEAKSSMLSFS